LVFDISFHVTRRPIERDEVRGAFALLSLFTRFLNALDRDEEGQGLAEYALILALIAIVAIVALIFLGGQVSKILSTVGSSL
jgi:pilus assembly protein Flp/PilA